MNKIINGKLFRETKAYTKLKVKEPIIMRLYNEKRINISYDNMIAATDSTFSIEVKEGDVWYFYKWINLIKEPMSGAKTYPIELDTECNFAYEYGVITQVHGNTGFSVGADSVYFIPREIVVTLDKKTIIVFNIITRI